MFKACKLYLLNLNYLKEVMLRIFPKALHCDADCYAIGGWQIRHKIIGTAEPFKFLPQNKEEL